MHGRSIVMRKPDLEGQHDDDDECTTTIAWIADMGAELFQSPVQLRCLHIPDG